MASRREGDSEAGITQMSKFLVGQQAKRVSGKSMAHCAALLAEVLRKSGRISEALNVATDAINQNPAERGPLLRG